MTFDILTIFPDFFAGPFTHGVLRRAIANGVVQIATHDLRRFTHDRHRKVDDRPFGGGEGMVLKPEPIFDCFDTLGITSKASRVQARETVILLSAQGRPFTQSIAVELAAATRVIFLCGRYEGVDERVNDLLCDRELSIGDYVLSGGELAAAVILDAVVRLLPGVLGNPDSSRFESFGGEDSGASHEPGAVPPFHPRRRRPARLPPLHPPRGLPRSPHPRGPRQRRSPRHPSLAPRASPRKDLPQSARSAASRGPHRRRP